MQLIRNYKTYLVILLVLCAYCLQETEATRRVNRGRRTLTRRYFNGLAIPGWALILCVAIGELVVGAALYFILYKVMLSKDPEQGATYTPAPAHDTTATTVPASTPPAAHATTIA